MALNVDVEQTLTTSPPRIVPNPTIAGARKKKTKKGLYTCRVCKKVFPNEALLLRHIDSHSKVPKYKCPVCGKLFKHRHNLRCHYAVHDESLVQKCTECDFKCGSASQLKQHMGKHSNILYKCIICNKFFKAKNTFTQHLRLHSNTNVSICEICGKKFALACQLKKHMESHSDDKKHKCRFCKRTYKQLRGLRRHEIEQHKGKTAKTYACGICGKVWATPSTLRKHEMSHQKNLSFKCNTCGEIFLQRTSYELHCRLHGAIYKTYKCDICGKMFACKSWLECHKNFHFKESKVKCLYCDEYFTSKYSLQRHVKKLHEGNDSTKCTECMKLSPSIKVDSMTCQLVHSKQPKVVLRKLTPSDLSKSVEDVPITSDLLKSVEDGLVTSDAPTSQSSTSVRPKRKRVDKRNKLNVVVEYYIDGLSAITEVNANGIVANREVSAADSGVHSSTDQHHSPRQCVSCTSELVCQNGAYEYVKPKNRTPCYREIDLSAIKEMQQSNGLPSSTTTTNFGNENSVSNPDVIHVKTEESAGDIPIQGPNVIHFKTEESAGYNVVQGPDFIHVKTEVEIESTDVEHIVPVSTTMIETGEKVINIVPIGSIMSYDDTSFDENDVEIPPVAMAREMAPKITRYAESECLLISENKVPFCQKIFIEFPFLRIREEHKYPVWELTDMFVIAQNTCIHGNRISKLEDLCRT